MNQGLGKRGSEKYYYIISLILGILIIFIVFYFLFHEYFTSDDINWESCRQSIVLRNTMPNVKIGQLTTIGALKNAFPLKCKTEVINIDYENKNKLEEEIRGALLSSWWLVGYGDFKVFPSDQWGIHQPCLVTTRIHVEEGVRKFYKGDNKIDLGLTISKKIENDKKFFEYLSGLGDTKAFKFVKGYDNQFGVFDYEDEENLAGIKLPRYFDVDKDLLIVVSSPTDSKGPFSKPYLVFLHTDRLEELEEEWFAKYDLPGIGEIKKINVCDSFETIPA